MTSSFHKLAAQQPFYTMHFGRDVRRRETRNLCDLFCRLAFEVEHHDLAIYGLQLLD